MARLVYKGASVLGQVASHQHFPTSPRNNGGSICLLAIRSIEACGLQMAGDLCSVKSPLDDVIEGCMVGMMAFAESAMKFMCVTIALQ